MSGILDVRGSASGFPEKTKSGENGMQLFFFGHIAAREKRLCRCPFPLLETF